MPNRYIRSIYPLLVAFGCARATLPEPPGPKEAAGPQDAPVSAPVTGSGESWTIVSSIEPQTYTSVSHIELNLSTSSGISRDTMAVTTRYSLSIDRTSESAPLSGRVDLFSVQAGSRIGAVTSPDIPLTFSGRITDGQVTLDPAGQVQRIGTQIACPDTWSTAVSGVRRSIFLIPQQLARGMTWTDSTSSTACHGSIPLSLKASYTYKVIGEVNHWSNRAILIERTGRISSTGEGSEGQHRVAVITEGSTTGNFHIDRATGVLLDAQDEQRTRVVVTSSGRNQVFAQVIREKTTLTGR